MSAVTPAPMQPRVLWRLAIAVWVAAGAAAAATALLRSQKPAAIASMTCSIDELGAARWLGAQGSASADGAEPSPETLAQQEAIALAAPSKAPASALVRALSVAERTDPILVALAAPGATSAAPSFALVSPPSADPLDVDADPVHIRPLPQSQSWIIESLGVSATCDALEAAATLARLRGPARPIAATQPLHIHVGGVDWGTARDVISGVLRQAPEARIVLISGDLP